MSHVAHFNSPQFNVIKSMFGLALVRGERCSMNPSICLFLISAWGSPRSLAPFLACMLPISLFLWLPIAPWPEWRLYRADGVDGPQEMERSCSQAQLGQATCLAVAYFLSISCGPSTPSALYREASFIAWVSPIVVRWRKHVPTFRGMHKKAWLRAAGFKNLGGRVPPPKNPFSGEHFFGKSVF